MTTDVYELLQRRELEGESFSDLLRRIATSEGKLRRHFGALADEPRAFFDAMEQVIAAVDRA